MQNDAIGSADVIARVRPSQSLVMMTLTSDINADPITFNGTASDFERSQSIGLNVNITQANLAAINLQQTAPGDWAFLDPDGNPTGFGVRAYSMTQAMGRGYEIHSGIYFDDQGNKAEFVLSTDPLPAAAVVIIVVVSIAAAVCLAGIAISAVIADCKKSQADAIASCGASGGLASMNTTVDIAPNFDVATKKFTLGCRVECSVTCTPGS
ncbi:MAG: hypothetical protein WCF84_08350 [Anaerolineae bacterium]